MVLNDAWIVFMNFLVFCYFDGFKGSLGFYSGPYGSSRVPLGYLLHKVSCRISLRCRFRILLHAIGSSLRVSVRVFFTVCSRF